MKLSPKTADAGLVIGIDFDNTIIQYGNLFFEAGVSLGVISGNSSCSKKKVREYLIGLGKEDYWTRIQGLVYGEYIQKAKVMEGFFPFIHTCHEKGWDVFIISHKTYNSITGERFNLHTAASNWLEKKGIYGPDIQGVVKGVFFEETRLRKVCRINQLGCDIMIDDLPDVLLHPDLSSEIFRILYDPDRTSELDPRYVTSRTWDQVHGIIERHYE